MTEGPCANPDAVLTIDDDLLLACARREKSLVDCIRLKQVEATGDLSLFERLMEKIPKKE